MSDFAYPSEERNHDGSVYKFHPGMTLRDYFAARALHAIVISDGIQYASQTDDHAKWAYVQADAMLAARKS